MKNLSAAAARIAPGSALFFALIVIPSAVSAGTEMRNHATLGYDSFIDRFTILEADTFESVQEQYLGLGNALQYWNGKAKAGINNHFRLGTQTIDESFDAEASFAPAPATVIDLRGGVHWKHFQEKSDYEFGNDYLQSNALLKIRKKFGEWSRATLRGRIESIDYEEKTDFDYDYRYLDGGIEIEAGPDPARMLLLGISRGSREVPDTTALSYDRILAELEARLISSRGVSFHLSSAGDRRDYRGAVRSSLWNAVSFLDASYNTAGGMVYSLRAEAELAFFDRPDTIYFDTQFLRGGARVRYPVRDLSSVYIEPRAAWMFCPDFEEERYGEFSCILGADIMHTDRLWLSLSYEPGYRDYTVAENDLYSDFTLNRVSAMGSVSLPASMALNLFLTHEPERHSRREDDFSVTLVTVDVTKRF